MRASFNGSSTPSSWRGKHSKTAWSTTGLTLATVTPRAVIREAFQAKLIDDGETWTDMLADRNKVSHTYDNETFLETIRNIRRRYLAVLGDLYERLGQESSGP